MKLWNLLGAVPRYVLAAISCVYFAQFFLLLGVSTDDARYLAGKSIVKAVFYGVVAAVWFYWNRKVSLSKQAAAQKQSQLPSQGEAQAQSARQPLDSIPTSTFVSIPTPVTDKSGTDLAYGTYVTIAACVIALFILALILTRTSQQTAPPPIPPAAQTHDEVTAASRHDSGLEPCPITMSPISFTELSSMIEFQRRFLGKDEGDLLALFGVPKDSDDILGQTLLTFPAQTSTGGREFSASVDDKTGRVGAVTVTFNKSEQMLLETILAKKEQFVFKSIAPGNHDTIRAAAPL
jgi:hypothetical protein